MKSAYRRFPPDVDRLVTHGIDHFGKFFSDNKVSVVILKHVFELLNRIIPICYLAKRRGAVSCMRSQDARHAFLPHHAHHPGLP